MYIMFKIPLKGNHQLYFTRVNHCTYYSRAVTLFDYFTFSGISVCFSV